MISSMTAFARCESQGEWGKAVWEIRSINHRYLEINTRLPELWNVLEPQLRERIKNKLQRGKIDITLRFESNINNVSALAVNYPLVAQLIRIQEELVKISGVQENLLKPIEIMKWPSVLQVVETKSDELEENILNVFDATLKELINARQREGIVLRDFLNQRLLAMQDQVKQVKIHLPEIIQDQRQKLLARLAEIKIAFDENRLEQEMVYFAQKLDVAEELDRLTAHIDEAKKTLAQGGAVGRRLDFLFQELNREANTLGSKSASSLMTMTAVELKVLMEQGREQVQNIE
jgi:uncharacterized protein (TIGR00255 family)